MRGFRVTSTDEPLNNHRMDSSRNSVCASPVCGSSAARVPGPPHECQEAAPHGVHRSAALVNREGHLSLPPTVSYSQYMLSPGSFVHHSLSSLAATAAASRDKSEQHDRQHMQNEPGKPAQINQKSKFDKIAEQTSLAITRVNMYNATVANPTIPDLVQSAVRQGVTTEFNTKMIFFK